MDQILSFVLPESKNASRQKCFQDLFVKHLLKDDNIMDWECIRNILLKDPVICSTMKLANGRYVLHYACLKCAPFDIVELLYKHNPDAVNAKVYTDGCYPLHYALRCNQSESVIQFLIITNPKIVHEIQRDGWYPLHIACRYNQTKNVIQMLIDYHAAALAIKLPNDKENDANWYPLHLACGYRQSNEVISLLLHHYPMAAEYDTTIDRNYPLHLACARGASFEAVKLLLQAYPAAIKEKNALGYYPLHLACCTEMSRSVSESESTVRLLNEAYPRAVREPSIIDGFYPIHCARGYGMHLSIVKYLIQQWPESVHARTKKGNTALDLLKNPFKSTDCNPDKFRTETINWFENSLDGWLQQLNETQNTKT